MSKEEKVASATEPMPAVGKALAALSLSVLLPSLGTSIANVALPTLSEVFGASFQQVQWIVLAYLLATTTLVVSAGKLGDLVGRRRLLIGGIALFIAASVAGALAPNLWLLVAARAAQGAGAAVMMALIMAFVGATVPKARTGSAMGLLGTMSAVGTALGPSLGGFLIAGFGWQAIFALNLPLGVVAVLLVRRYLPGDRAEAKGSKPSFDIAGTLILASMLAAYALATTIGRGSFGLFNVALLAVAAVGVGFFVFIETRAKSPLIRLTMFRDRTLSAALAASALVSTVVMATLVVGPFYLSHGLRLETLAVGFAMSIGPLVAAVAGAPAGRLADRLGAHRVACAGLVGMIAGCVALFATPTSFGVLGYVVPIAVLTAGYAAFQAANNTSMMAELPQEQRGVVAGLLALSRNLGLITGASVMGAVFAFASGPSSLAAAVPQAVAAGMRFTFAAAAVVVLFALALAVMSQVRASPAARLNAQARA